MNFRTELPNPQYDFNINHTDKLISIGSCFADVIAKQMNQYKFNIVGNPFGTIFNPISIFKILKPKEDLTRNTFETNDNWLNYDVHSSFVSENSTTLNQEIKTKKQVLDDCLKEANYLILTFGTAWVYKLKSTQTIVSNCHKMPSNLFNKVILSVEDITNEFDSWYSSILKINPTLKIILTVSPVRHIKDTIELNSVSKSILRVVCHLLQNKHPNIYYFPSYEIVMDDLRDYRFYKSDLIHPNETAEEYIWDKWKTSLFNSETNDFIKEWNQILLNIQHKPFKPNTIEYQKFIQHTIQKIERISINIDTSEEMFQLKNKLDHGNSNH